MSEIGEALCLQSSDRGLGAFGEVLLPPHARLVHDGVVARHLFDDAHDLPVGAVPGEVSPVGPQDAVELSGVGSGRVAVVRGRQHGFLGLGDLAEDLLLRIEVVIEAAVGHAGALGDVGDAGLEEPGLFEFLLGRLDESCSCGCTFPRPWSLGRNVVDLGDSGHDPTGFLRPGPDGGSCPIASSNVDIDVKIIMPDLARVTGMDERARRASSTARVNA